MGNAVPMERNAFLRKSHASLIECHDTKKWEKVVKEANTPQVQ